MTVLYLGDALAAVLNYPGPGYRQQVEYCRQLLEEVDSEAAFLMGSFAAAIAQLSTAALEELFTRTFDLSPTCALEVGWHLFGEDYNRGKFMARIREELQRHQIAESHELPDHLTHVLRLVTRLEEAEGADFIAHFALPGVERMLASLAGKENPYESVLAAVRRVLERHLCHPRQEEIHGY